MKLIAASALVLFALLFAAPYSHAFAESNVPKDVKSIMTAYKFALEKARADFKAAIDKSQKDARDAISKGIEIDKINADSKAAISKARLDYSAALKKAQLDAKTSLNQLKATVDKKLK